ncbi:MAG: hypothetical protein AB1921_02210 [Thermodesulfobacteriota bacterium]
MSEYNAQQRQAYEVALSGIEALGPEGLARLREEVAPYLAFRARVDDFLARHVSELCTEVCFTDKTSACCSKEGIITFFADAVVNALSSPSEMLEAMISRLEEDPPGPKCVYLSPSGCLWKVTPIVCVMFLCDRAEEKIRQDGAEETWRALKEERNSFTYPNRPVLFDAIEETFLRLGLSSGLMHLHMSPGLLRVKKKSGLIP